MEICEQGNSEISGEEIGSFDFTSQIDRELLRGEGKPDLHPLIKKEVYQKLGDRISDINRAEFHIDGIEKGNRPIVRLHVVAYQTF